MPKKFRALTKNEFIVLQQIAFPYAKGDLTRLMDLADKFMQING